MTDKDVMQMAYDLLCRPVDTIAEMYCFDLGDCDETRAALREALEVSSGGMASSSGGMAQPQGEWVDLTGKDWRSALKEAETIVQKSDPLEALLQVFGERLLAKFKEKNTPVQREQQEPVACMVKGRLLSYKDNTIPNDCLLYLAPPSVEAMRLETLEKAAKACDDLGKTPFIPNHDVHVLPPTPQQCAAAIRGMK